jgi:uncharacterized RDD family membrane protein YckC
MQDKSQFAGFWKRCAAFLIDSLIIGFGQTILIGVIVALCLIVFKMERNSVGASLGIIFYLMIVAIHIAYFALFESSSKQATPGKMAMGIVVTNAQGGRIGLGRAIGRNCARFLSALFFGLGYVICGFTDLRQCVHDLVAGTLVVKKDAPLRLGPNESFQIMQSQ